MSQLDSPSISRELQEKTLLRFSAQEEDEIRRKKGNLQECHARKKQIRLFYFPWSLISILKKLSRNKLLQ